MLNNDFFRDPPARFAPGYFWIINDPMDADTMIAQLKEMADRGARSVCMHPFPKEFQGTTNMSPAYLSPEYHAVMAKVAAAADKLGMHWYLYDEGGWPSGSACGQVWANNPERFARTYAELDEKGEVRIVKYPEDPSRRAPVPDVLVPGATELFLKLTHEAYAEYLRPYFGKSVLFTFTDEPVMPRSDLAAGKLGWTADLPEEFRRRKGYDLLPHVPALLREMPMPGTRTAEVLLDYREVMADLFEERFLLPIREWCRRNGLLSGGHLEGEDEWCRYGIRGFGNLLQSLRALDMPGVDMIWHQLYPGERLHPFPKLASGAAHQNDVRQVLGELFAIYGAGTHPDMLKYLIDYMLVCGVNSFVFSAIAMTVRDARMGIVSFGPQSPLWPYFNEFHEYVAAMSALLCQGRSVTDTALFLDLRAFELGGRTNEYAVYRALKSADTLLEAQCDFDYIDDRMLARAEFVGGELVVGKMRYRRLVLPGRCLFSETGEKKLAELRNAGFPVFDSSDPAALAPLVALDHPEKALRVTKRDLGDGEYGYFVFNTSDRKIDVKLTLPETVPVAVAEPGSRRWFAVPSVNGSFAWTFQPRESRYFLVGGHVPAEPMPPAPGTAVAELKDGWTIRPLWKRFPGEHEYETQNCTAPARSAAPGDWRPLLGEDFSGEAVYTLDFDCAEPEKAAFLDLGKVCYAARVSLNGKSLGGRMLSPFIFPLGDSLRKGENHLEITVTNTLANVINSAPVQEAWKRRFRPSEYTPMLRSFEHESFCSGLLGPVVLRAADGRDTMLVPPPMNKDKEKNA